MSTPASQNFAVDISKQNVKGQCDYKCAYSFNYGTSNSIATNQGEYLSLSYENKSTPPVKYNSLEYKVDNVRIYFPSLHTFNGRQTDGELIIEHTPATTGNKLLVCVPIVKGDLSNNNTDMLNHIVYEVTKKTPNVNETTNVFSGFKLNTFIPKNGYYVYTGPMPYQPFNSTVDYIVFDSYEGAIRIGKDTLFDMKDIIKDSRYVIKTGGKLFYNNKHPNQSKDNKIYIKCSPTGSSGETNVVKNKGGNTSANRILNSDPVNILISTIIFAGLIFGARALLKKVD